MPNCVKLAVFYAGNAQYIFVDFFIRPGVNRHIFARYNIIMVRRAPPVLLYQLQQKGFKQSQQDDVICRLRLGELKVDFMPEDAETADLLGCNNRWFKDGLANAQWHTLPSGCRIRLFTPPYFLGSKLEAYAGRGAQNPLGSQDLEDILNLVNGREELLQEVDAAAPELRTYLANKLTALLSNNDFGYLVQDAARGDQEREQIIWQRLRHITQVTA